VQAIVARHPRGRIAVGTHGDIVRMLVTHYAGAHLDLFQRNASDPASVSVVLLGDGSPRVLLVNDTGGLERFGPTRRAKPNLRG
jgi:broad specificity phosphatase PhoE